jgi:hypothetical protein
LPARVSVKSKLLLLVFKTLESIIAGRSSDTEGYLWGKYPIAANLLARFLLISSQFYLAQKGSFPQEFLT